MARFLALLLETIGLGRTGAYRPEAHYMRGPGPKCRAKFGPVDMAARR